MFKLLIFLSVLGILGECYADEADKLCNCENVLTYDDAAIRILGQQVQLLNENLRLRLDLLTMRFDHQFEIIKEQSAKWSTHSNVNAERTLLIDINAASTEPIPSSSSRHTCAAHRRLPANCAEATAVTRKSGLYKIQVDSLSLHSQPFLAACDEETQGGGWTVVQRRLNGSIDFYRNWTDYKEGFGNLAGEFFIGLDRLHALTTDTPQELLITMEDFDEAKRFAKYDAFAIGDETEAYALKLLGNYTGDAGDSLSPHISFKWSTKDVDNGHNPLYNCAVHFTGAWWYNKCHVSNLNGLYLQPQSAQGVVWHSFRGYDYSLKHVQIMIRPQRM